jgi:cell wall-associated NlpC family hydrolase
MSSNPFARTLREGSVGRDVRAVKNTLRRLGYQGMDFSSAKYGAGTVAAVERFQKKHGIDTGHGTYGPGTHALLSPSMGRTDLARYRAVYAKLHPVKPKPKTDRQRLVDAAYLIYNNRASITYSQNAVLRWEGLHNGIRPPQFPRHSDCSSAVSWDYWLVFGSGPDFLNGQNWKAGYTGTQINHGKKISVGQARPGDLVFYGSTPWNITHVAIYVGNGRVISHGSDPVGIYPVGYRLDLQFAHSYLP